MPPTPFDDPQYQKSSFEAMISGQPKRFDIYQRGEGRPLVLIQELPGIRPAHARIRRQAGRGGLFNHCSASVWSHRQDRYGVQPLAGILYAP